LKKFDIPKQFHSSVIAEIKEKRKNADINAAKFGRTKAERLIDVMRDEKARKMLDQHEMEEE